MTNYTKAAEEYVPHVNVEGRAYHGFLAGANHADPIAYRRGLEDAAKYVDDYSTQMGEEIRALMKEEK